MAAQGRSRNRWLGDLRRFVDQWETGVVDGQEVVVDTLANLRHFAAEHAVDFDEAIRLSEIHASIEDSGRECEGHHPGPFDPMGETVYCDGTCQR